MSSVQIPSDDPDLSTSEDDDEDGDENSTFDLSALEQAVSSNPTFEAYSALVQAVRSAGDLQSLRAHREAFHAAFPLPPSQWHEWLEDEIRLASTPDAKVKLLPLFSRAVEDYLCIDLHLKRLSFVIQCYQESLVSKDEVHNAFHHSVTCGATAHFTRGVQLCETYASFLRRSGMAEVEVEKFMTPHWKVPLRGRTDETFESVRQACEVFEGRLEAAKTETGPGLGGGELLMQYRSYAEYCKGVNDALTVAVYERCIAECFLRKEAWMDYILMCIQKGGRFAVCRRACRNVPWALEFWMYAVLALPQAEEKEIGGSKAEVLKRLIHDMRGHVMGSRDLRGAQRLTCGIWETYQKLGGLEEMKEAVWSTLEFNVEGTEAWAVALSYVARVLKKEGEEWKEVIERVVNKRGGEARWWISYGSLDASVLERAMKSVESREVARLVDGWVEHVGSDLGKVYALASARESSGDGPTGDGKRRKGRADGKERSMGKRKRVRAERVNGGVDKKKKDQKKDESEMKDVEGPKAEGGMENGDADKEDETMQDEATGADSKGTQPIAQEPQSVPGSKTGEVPQTASRDAEGVEPRTIYVNNLPFSVSEEDLREHFEPCGDIIQIRLQRRSDGASKGRAYIEFSDETSVDKSVEKHQQPLKGRSIWVRRSRPPKRAVKKPRMNRATMGRVSQRRQQIRIDANVDETPKTQDELRKMMLG